MWYALRIDSQTFKDIVNVVSWLYKDNYFYIIIGNRAENSMSKIHGIIICSRDVV